MFKQPQAASSKQQLETTGLMAPVVTKDWPQGGRFSISRAPERPLVATARLRGDQGSGSGRRWNGPHFARRQGQRRSATAAQVRHIEPKTQPESDLVLGPTPAPTPHSLYTDSPGAGRPLACYSLSGFLRLGFLERAWSLERASVAAVYCSCSTVARRGERRLVWRPRSGSPSQTGHPYR
jgi:hypothetical protein